MDRAPLPEPRLEVLRSLGSGATARVDLVRLLEPWNGLAAGTELARKTLANALAHDPGARAALRQEAEAGTVTRSPSLVRVQHAGEDGGQPYLLLSYVPGRSVRELADEDGPLPEPLVRALGAGLASALAELHRHGFVHGDVKPENARLDARGRAVLLDLGFARRAHAAGDGSSAGSLAYLSPERARGEPAQPAADVFALGVVLYELCTGAHPFAPGLTTTRSAGALVRARSSGALLRRSLELSGADELLAAIGTGHVLPPSRLVPTLSPFLDRCLTEVLARAPGDRPSAEELERRLAQGELGAWWRGHLDEREAPGPSTAPGAIPLVGRERELGTLFALERELHPADGARARSAVVWLTGPEGSGKWRLATGFAEQLRTSAQPPLVLDARATEADEARAGGALLQLLNRWLFLPVGNAAGERERERMAELVGAASARAFADALDPRRPEAVDRSIAFELGRWLAALAETRTLLLFVDDVHQAGRATLEALSSAMEALSASPVLWVLVMREDVPATEAQVLARLRERLERGATGGGPAFRRIELRPLDPAAVGELVRALFHDTVPLVRLSEVLWKRSRGNPGFLAEILRDLEQRGDIRPASDEDARLVLTIAPEDLPQAPSLDRLVRERFRALDAGDRRWLERMSVVGGRLEPEFLVQTFPPTTRPEIDAVLARLSRKHWLVGAEDRYRFERPALREAVYRSVPAARRKRLHVAAARGLALHSPGEDPALQDLERDYQRAFHLNAAGEHAELLATIRRTIPPLRRRAPAQRLLTLARWGLAALEKLPAEDGTERLRLELLEEAADAADRLGRREDQRMLLDHLSSIELDPETHSAEGARLYLLHSRYAAGTGQFALARGWLKTAITLAQRSDDRWLYSQALRRMAQVQAQVGEFTDARARARAALRAAVGENQEALAHLALAHVDVLEDRLEEALASVGAALTALRRTAEPRAGVVAYAELLHGRIWRSLGVPERALASIQRAVRMARRAGERRLEAEALARRGGLLLDLDRPAEAQAELRNALLLSDEIEDRRGQVLSTLWLGLLEAEEGAGGARTSLLRAVELAHEIGFYRAVSLGESLLARLFRSHGDLAGAESASARAHELLERHGAELTDRVVVAGTRVFVLRLLGRDGEAELVLHELQRRVRASQRRLARALRPGQRAYVERLLAAVLSAEGPVLPRRT